MVESPAECDRSSFFSTDRSLLPSTTVRRVGAVYEPVGQRLLPLDVQWREGLAKVGWPTGTLPEVMGSGYLFISLFRACAESLASENASRLAAMERADRTSTICWTASTDPSIACAKAASTESCSTSSPASRRW